jgi:hypothetical protein
MQEMHPNNDKHYIGSSAIGKGDDWEDSTAGCLPLPVCV